MKILTRVILWSAVLCCLVACRQVTEQESSVSSSTISQKPSVVKSSQEKEAGMRVEINGQAVQVAWAENVTVQALREQVVEAPVELTVEDYAGMEKVGNLPVSLPSSNQQMNTDAGDITLFAGRALAFYYGRNQYSLTPIGRIEGMSKEEIRELLTSQERLTVTISMDS